MTVSQWTGFRRETCKTHGFLTEAGHFSKGMKGANILKWYMEAQITMLIGYLFLSLVEEEELEPRGMGTGLEGHRSHRLYHRHRCDCRGQASQMLWENKERFSDTWVSRMWMGPWASGGAEQIAFPQVGWQKSKTVLSSDIEADKMLSNSGYSLEKGLKLQERVPASQFLELSGKCWQKKGNQQVCQRFLIGIDHK